MFFRKGWRSALTDRRVPTRAHIVTAKDACMVTCSKHDLRSCLQTMSSKGKGKDKGKGNNKGSHHPPSQSGTAGPAPSPSGPIAGPSHYATRRSRRLNPDMAPPSASALGAEHASLTADSDNPDHAFTPPITPYIALTYLIVDDRFNPLENIFAVRELSTHLIADVMES